MPRHHIQPCRRPRGQGLAELGLVTPVLLTAFLVVIEAGWFLRSYIVVGTAAREGARYGSRGPHMTVDVLDAAQDIASQASTSLGQLVDMDLEGSESNTAILVTLVEIEADGSWTVLPSGGSPPTYKLGSLSAVSEVCVSNPCSEDSFNLISVAQDNASFNADSALCDVGEECTNDLVVVEVGYMHAPLIFKFSFVPERVPISSRAVMRVLAEP